MIYLASPYSHPCLTIREQRFHAACIAVVALMRQGQVVFAPIVHGHPLVDHGLPVEWPFWERSCNAHVERCDEFAVLMLDGWRQSVGVNAEIRIAEELGKPIRYLDPPVSHTLAPVTKEDEA